MPSPWRHGFKFGRANAPKSTRIADLIEKTKHEKGNNPLAQYPDNEYVGQVLWRKRTVGKHGFPAQPRDEEE